MSLRDLRAAIAHETLAIVDAGRYTSASGRAVDIADAVRACVAATRVVMPGEAVSFAPSLSYDTSFEVGNENTLTAIARRVAAGDRRVGVLNFASPHRPGGGFRTGAEAQEEAIARSSALFASLVGPGGCAFYRHDVPLDGLYTDRVIVSPECPVFRDASARLIDAPLPATVLTCAAPNLTALRANAPHLEALVAQTFDRRIARVLAVAARAACDTLVLGAWGCGVFGNDPVLVAEAFARQLRVGAFAGVFRHVDFAVLDGSEGARRFEAFVRAFGRSTLLPGGGQI